MCNDIIEFNFDADMYTEEEAKARLILMKLAFGLDSREKLKALIELYYEYGMTRRWLGEGWIDLETEIERLGRLY